MPINRAGDKDRDVRWADARFSERVITGGSGGTSRTVDETLLPPRLTSIPPNLNYGLDEHWEWTRWDWRAILDKLHGGHLFQTTSLQGNGVYHLGGLPVGTFLELNTPEHTGVQSGVYGSGATAIPWGPLNLGALDMESVAATTEGVLISASAFSGRGLDLDGYALIVLGNNPRTVKSLTDMGNFSGVVIGLNPANPDEGDVYLVYQGAIQVSLRAMSGGGASSVGGWNVFDNGFGVGIVDPASLAYLLSKDRANADELRLAIGDSVPSAAGFKVRGSGLTEIQRLKRPYRTVTADATVNTRDYTVKVNATSAAVLVTMLDAASVDGQEFNVKNMPTSTKRVSVTTTSSQSIDSLSLPLVLSPGDNLQLQSTDGYWIIL